MSTEYFSHLETPLGWVQIRAAEAAITAVRFVPEPLHGTRENAWSRLGAEQLEAYFQGRRRSFDLPLAPQGTAFQREAWEALRRIPYGETRSYGEQAQSIDRPRAVRAVGAANGANPISIVVPCHRVIGRDGSLTGYGGGVERKAWLLAFEQGASPESLLKGSLNLCSEASKTLET